MEQFNHPFEVVTEIEMRKLSEIKPYFRNPRKNDKTVAALVDLIPRAGFNVPIVIDEDNIIVKGHARYKAAIRLGLEKVPCVVTHADEENKNLDRLADNKTSELSEWLNDDLLHELDMLNTDFDVTKLGFPAINVDDIFSAEEPDLGGFDFPDNSSAPAEDDRERQARYQQFLDTQPKSPLPELITTEASIEKAIRHQQSIPEKPKRYFKMVCENCGHIMFVAEGEALFEDR